MQSSPSSPADRPGRQPHDGWRPGLEQGLLDPEWLRFWGTVPAKAVQVPGLGTSVVGYSGRCILFGAIVVNATAGAGHVSVFDGLDATGGLLDRVDFSAAGSAALSIPARGVYVSIGVYWAPASIFATGTLWLAPLDRYPGVPPGW